jgi:hypothetical protein
MRNGQLAESTAHHDLVNVLSTRLLARPSSLSVALGLRLTSRPASVETVGPGPEAPAGEAPERADAAPAHGGRRGPQSDIGSKPPGITVLADETGSLLDGEQRGRHEQARSEHVIDRCVRVGINAGDRGGQ